MVEGQGAGLVIDQPHILTLKKKLNMENNNWEPRIGQKVVALGTAFDNSIKKGNHYTVAVVFKCPRCGSFHILLEGLFAHPGEYPSNYECECCDDPIYKANLIGGASKYFAPVPPAYENISKELAEKAMEVKTETDVPVREVVNN